MKRTLMTLAAVGGLTLSTALAQSPSNTNTSSNSSASQSTTSTMSTPGAAISQQRPDQWLASKFKGTGVIGMNDEKIGNVSDILFDKSGKMDAVVVGVGGFLGIGSKDVALPLTTFQVVPGADAGADKLRLPMTKDQLMQTAEFKPLRTSKTTTGAAGSSTTRPASSPMSPSPSSR